MPFEIVVHEADRIIEVKYPGEPTHQDVAQYLLAMKRAIDGRVGPWKCLVDQTELKVLDPVLIERISTLNSYAQSKGMTCSARVVTSSVGALQAQRIATSASLRAQVKVFETRDDAIAWLRGEP